MVPESLKAVALWYDKSASRDPADDDRRAARRRQGRLASSSASTRASTTSSAGPAPSVATLMDDTGKCIADQGGFADAFAYLKDLKDAGATFNTDGNALKTDFQTGEINAIIDGPWQTADFRTALGDNARRRADPGRPRRRRQPASPAPTAGTSTPTSTRTVDLAVDVRPRADVGPRASRSSSTTPATCPRQPGGHDHRSRSPRASPTPPRPACPDRRTSSSATSGARSATR